MQPQWRRQQNHSCKTLYSRLLATIYVVQKPGHENRAPGIGISGAIGNVGVEQAKSIHLLLSSRDGS